MSNSKITVILPIYNGMPFLKESVESLKQQTFQDFIVLLINNGSTDSTKEFISSINDDRFKYYELEKPNLVKALNFGLQFVDTEFIARMDADDISHPKRFEKQIDFLESNKNIDVVGTQGKYIGCTSNSELNINLPIYHEKIISTMLNNNHSIIHASILFRQSIVKNKHLYDENYFPCEDFELFLRLAKEVIFANLPDRLYFFRVHQYSIL
ncbi:MAG: glycosyltransferase, partial [Flavobacteriaceae bacterium]|nr:glycosyltransferase [Flavobacteriaceae bacterium]